MIGSQLSKVATITLPTKIKMKSPKIMAMEVMRNISTSLQNSPFIWLMMDETTDISNHEYGAIVLHHVTDKMEVLEELIGMYQVPSIDFKTLAQVAKDTPL